MSSSKKKIGLICESIEFTKFSIVYNVVPNEIIVDGNYPVFCSDDISEKDLILNPTVFNKKNSRVVFNPSNVTPLFYKQIMDKSIKNIEEYVFDVNNIYRVGELVAFILV